MGWEEFETGLHVFWKIVGDEQVDVGVSDCGDFFCAVRKVEILAQFLAPGIRFLL